MMNILEVNKRLKQRPPFQMIEKVLELNAGESAVGIKNVSINEPYFMGHFPDTPIMPGVLIVESCAQLCSLVIEGDGTDDGLIYVLLKIDKFKFIKPVLPGDPLNADVVQSAGVQNLPGGIEAGHAAAGADLAAPSEGAVHPPAGPKGKHDGRQHQKIGGVIAEAV